MPSEFDSFASAFAAPSLVQQFGERDESGDLDAVLYHPPGGGNPVALVGVIVGTLDVQLVEDDKGNAVKRETVSVDIPTSADNAPSRIEKKAKLVIPRFGNRVWVQQETGSKLSGSFLTYQLERKPLANMDAKTNARTV